MSLERKQRGSRLEKAKWTARVKNEMQKYTKGLVTREFMRRGTVGTTWSTMQLSFGPVQVVIRPEDYKELEKNFESRKLCNMKSDLYDLTTKVGKLRNIASYMRTVHGSTKAVLALSDSEFFALLRRYVEDTFADRSCKL